jgi:phage portal protein BeeE
MEWLEGQKWYFHLVFGIFGVSPTEAGFHENVNRSTQEGQERITVKNAIKPYLEVFEKAITKNIIEEILQEENPGIEFKFMPKDHAEEEIEFTQSMQELAAGTLTVNEYRKMRGRGPVEGGDVTNHQMMQTQMGSNEEDTSDDEEEEQPQKMISYSKAFEAYMVR